MAADSYNLSKPEAAAALGISEAQLSGWLGRFDLFPAVRRGTGYNQPFTIREMMKLGVFKTLVDAGFSLGTAAKLVASTSPYGTLLDGRDGGFQVASFRDGEWSSVTHGDGDAVTISIPLWPIFDRLIEHFPPQALTPDYVLGITLRRQEFEGR